MEIMDQRASALMNLASYGGSDSLNIIVEQSAQVWLF